MCFQVSQYYTVQQSTNNLIRLYVVSYNAVVIASCSYMYMESRAVTHMNEVHVVH